MASSTIQFFVPGVPKPGGSKKGFIHARTGRVIVMEDCAKNKDWRASVAHEGRLVHQGALLSGPLFLEIVFVFCRPKSHYGTGKNAILLKSSAPIWHTQSPDSTKLVRSTEDALTKVLWVDDSQICEQRVTKRWVPRNVMSGAHVTVRKLDGETT
jgi:Holliday junction resolvase RusA-like endonuclease